MGSLALVSALQLDLDWFLEPGPVAAFFGFPSESRVRASTSKNKSHV